MQTLFFVLTSFHTYSKYTHKKVIASRDDLRKKRRVESKSSAREIPRNALKEVKAFEHSILHDFEIIDLHE